MWRRAICVRDLSLSHGGLEGLARRGFLRTESTRRLVGSFPHGLDRRGGGHRGRGERPEAESDDEGAGDLGSIALEGLGCRGRLEEQRFFVDFAGHLGSARMRRFNPCPLVRAVRDLWLR